MRKVMVLLLTVVLGLSLTLVGCSKTEKQAATQLEESKKDVITIIDDLGNTVTLDKKPEKIAAISGTYLGILYSAGGKAIAMADPKGGSPLPEGCEGLENVGAVYNINVEKLVSLQPDFVIAQFGLHNRLVPILNQSNIPVIVLRMKTFDDVVAKLRIMAQITGETEKVENIIKGMEAKKEKIVSKLPETPKKVAVLYLSSQEVSIKLENSIAGDVAKILKLKNIAEGIKPTKMGGETMPFSMEKVVEFDPDVILISTMISSQEVADEKLKKDIQSNPIWGELRAVKEGNIHFLPQTYFLYNAGEKCVEGIEIMAKFVYPEVFVNGTN
ncbi:MAG: ABC transporter substrate-binding protein [Halanaerobiales bacterium]|nr:ABC transporter substrate-binding protein [Halanaerobiales bacterium]